MSRHVPRPLLAGVAAALLAGPVTSTPAVATRPVPAELPAAAVAPGCAAPPAPARPVAAAPWPQDRYAPARLSALADGSGVTVAVVDSGVDRRHPQLAGRVLDGLDLLDPGGDGTRDCVGHGTGVASVIAAAPHDGVAFHGLAPNAKILPVRVSEQQVVDGQGAGRTVAAEEFATAIRWAVDNGADVINLSVVLYADRPPVRAAVAYAAARDVVVVAAAGNLHGEGDPRPYPAAYEPVIGVGAIGADGTRAGFSQTGPYVDLVAPGTDVLIAAPGRGHQRAEGTSYAAPFVAATAALVRQYRPDLSATEVTRRILATADPAPGEGYGVGVLNPYRAVTEEVGTTPRARPAGGLDVERPDPARAAQESRRSAVRERAALFTAAGLLAVTVVVLAAVLVPQGVRRRWRPAEPR
ncbi:type VII secretion-associated serine protease mycosin [Verrucosispora sp. TAA-831]|uniref:type VII secretion-associated serine protease mycosin n=1 Tax=Verrucosispora sp. TAA-831 TaxID=3422227 RepID=UPI003D6FDABD